MSYDLADSGWFVLVGVIVMIFFGVIAVRAGYIALTKKQSTRAMVQRREASERREADRPPNLAEPEPGAIWGVRAPGRPVERAGFQTAVAWASQDLTDGTALVKSLDAGATWTAVPRDQWRGGFTRP